DDDGPARTLPIENQKPGVKLKPVGTVPNGYVIDVFRQPGHGKLTYNFHAMINDSFEWNAIDAKKSPLDSLGKPTKPGAPNFNPVTGTAPETLIATWRMRRLPVPPLQRRGTEKQWLGVNFDPKSPRKFLKLRLLGVGKAKLFKEDVVTVKKGIQNSFTRVAATVQDMNGRVFAALIEPYAGKPFVKSAELLKIQGAGDGVNEPVAMRMECVNGRKDVVFVNASSKKEYAFDDVKVKGEAAMTAVDSQGLKYAMLTSGTSLTTPYVKIKLNKSHYAGKIKSIDFYAKKLTLDTKWKTPESANGGLLAIRGAKHTAVYNVEKFIGSGDDQLILKGSPFLAVLPVKTVFPEFGSVKCSIPPRTPVALSAEWTATNQKGTKAWRVKKLSDNMVALDGKVEDGDFPDGKLILWDIGVGYSVTMPTWATVRRVAPGKFIVKANTTATVSMKGTVEYSTGDGKWRKATVENGWSVIELNTDK
ncbi:MAG: hypothetical protein KAG97_04095, partial [Victivallales bacterium]|nr:hypothetical protein [Victivallales bacterium]